MMRHRLIIALLVVFVSVFLLYPNTNCHAAVIRGNEPKARLQVTESLLTRQNDKIHLRVAWVHSHLKETVRIEIWKNNSFVYLVTDNAPVGSAGIGSFEGDVAPATAVIGNPRKTDKYEIKVIGKSLSTGDNINGSSQIAAPFIPGGSTLSGAISESKE